MKKGTIAWLATMSAELARTAEHRFEKAKYAPSLEVLYESTIPQAMVAEMAHKHWLEIVALVEVHPVLPAAEEQIRAYMERDDNLELDPLQYGFDEEAREDLAPLIRELLDRLTD